MRKKIEIKARINRLRQQKNELWDQIDPDKFFDPDHEDLREKTKRLGVMIMTLEWVICTNDKTPKKKT